MNLIDLIILIPIGWGVYRGFTKGVIHEIAQIGALGLGIVVGIYLSKWIGGFVASVLNTNEEQTQIIAFLIAFIGTLILVFYIAGILEKVVKTVHLGLFNQLFGAAFASIKYIVILSVLINIINTADARGEYIKKESRENSLLYKPVGNAVPMLIPVIDDVLPEKTI